MIKQRQQEKNGQLECSEACFFFSNIIFICVMKCITFVRYFKILNSCLDVRE